VLEQAGKLDPHAIDTVRSQCWPDIRDEHELHDLLMNLVALPVGMVEAGCRPHWDSWYDCLVRTGRALAMTAGEIPCWVATERLDYARTLWLGENVDGIAKDAVLKKCVQGWVQILGPVTADRFAQMLSVDPTLVFQAFIAMEVQGLLMRGTFEKPATEADHDIEWCERRILQRIHKLTIGIRRKEIEPVAPASFMRWLLGWQHLGPQTQVSGEEGLLEALARLEGFEAPAIEWERTLLPARVADYNPAWLDRLCLSGAVGWGRVSPHPAFAAGDGAGPRRVIPSNAAPITFYVRDSAQWLALALRDQCVEERKLNQALTPDGLRAWELLKQRGACFVEDVQRLLNLTRHQTCSALWELAAAGLAAADGFDQLRTMIDPERKPIAVAAHSRLRSAAGRWSLFSADIAAPSDAMEKARHDDAAIESAARMLLARYGVVFRDLVARESNVPRWGALLRMLRRLEDRGEIRGGRFVSGFGGEQFALPEAVESLRAARHRDTQGKITVAGADPMNLAGILIPGERVPAVPGRSVVFHDGLVAGSEPDTAPNTTRLRQIRPARKPPVTPHIPPLPAREPVGSLSLFSPLSQGSATGD
jgi:ATP-dependent Lhr-like helicase